MSVKKAPLSKVLKVCDVTKKRPQHRYFPVNIPEVLGTGFLKTISVVAFELGLVLEKNFKKRKLEERLPLL